MSDKAEMVVIIDGRESLITSAGRDLVTFGGLVVTAWVLNTQMPPSGWLNAALAISWFLWLAGKSASHTKRMTVDQAITHLKSLPSSNKGRAV
jgi:hypothetical protein